jgi:serine/threonine protein kinase
VSDQAGRILGRYEVVRVLGTGSSARTLLCQDAESHLQVAVKELHFAHAESWKHLELFEREASVLSRLDHPGLPKIHEFFPVGDDATTLYIVQDFIEGVSLKERMESGPMLGRREVADLALGMLDILEYLHGRVPPVLHRDIKPSNILLRPDGTPVLVDFGGVLFGWRPPGAAGTTVVGTFGYMPPEQLVGQAGPTSDLYALGATLLHVVTGTPPADFPFDSGRLEVPADLPVDAPLAALIEALLRPAPRDRPSSADAARRILTGDSEADSGAAASNALASIPTRRKVTVAAGDGPRFVDMGAPPRDPNGKFQDVYRNLMHPLFPARSLSAPGLRAFGIVMSGVLSLMTFGVVPVIYAWASYVRRRKYNHVFRNGVFTRGVVRSVDKDGVEANYKYEFDVGDTSYVAFITYHHQMAKFWGQGDTVPVLYDPEDPTRCCFVYR